MNIKEERRSTIFCIFLIIVFSLFSVDLFALTDNDFFPLREKYPEVRPITTKALDEQFDNVLIVDVRSKFEYNVAHVNGAFLLPFDKKTFGVKLTSLRDKRDKMPLVFYCNGHTCAKSYKASQLSLSLGFENVFVYDSGIFDWMNAHPQRATLMGITPAIKDNILPNKEFAERLVNFDTFVKESRKDNSFVIDIRDPFQRTLVPDIPEIKNIPLDPLLKLINSGVWIEKKLLFFDAVGKQIRWLQYYLEHNGYYNYAFLNKGVLSISSNKGLIKEVKERSDRVTSSQTLLLELSQNSDITALDKRILLFAVSKIKFNNYATTDSKELISSFNITYERLESSLKSLVRNKYLKYNIVDPTIVFFINPALSWKGEIEKSLLKDKIDSFLSK